MSYKIAAASSDGSRIDWTFGEARHFLIYEVTEESQIQFVEQRNWTQEEPQERESSCGCKKTEVEHCSTGNCSGGGCQGNAGVIPKLSLVEDCRCILCQKTGFQIRKQLEKKAISAFDIDCGTMEAITKLASYFEKVDHHENLRDFHRKN